MPDPGVPAWVAMSNGLSARRGGHGGPGEVDTMVPNRWQRALRIATQVKVIHSLRALKTAYNNISSGRWLIGWLVRRHVMRSGWSVVEPISELSTRIHI